MSLEIYLYRLTVYHESIEIYLYLLAVYHESRDLLVQVGCIS